MHPRLILAAAGLTACAAGHDMAAMTTAGHGALPPAPALLVTTPAAGLPQPQDLADTNPDPNVVEVTLIAAPAEHSFLAGKPAAVWVYNGTIPGPTLRAKVGDKVVVHFKNALPEATTIHWHGMRVPVDMDGMVEIKAGATYDYTFTALDAGTFWYHPHMMTAKQVERGLYAGIVIDDPQPPALAAVADELLVLDDVLITEKTGALNEATDARIDMMGREGNLLIVGGVPAVRELSVTAGARRLWRIVNAANARFFKLRMVDGTLLQVGGDRGWLAAPVVLDSLLLVPGQRAMVLVAAQAGKAATLRAEPYERATMAGQTPGADLVRLVPTAAPTIEPSALPAVLGKLDALAAPTTTRKLVLDEKMKASSVAHGSGTMAAGTIEFTINGQVYPNVTAFATQKGTIEAWEVDNASEMDHPFHVHGFFFQVAGKAEWHDTINVAAKSKLNLRVAFDDRPGIVGTWLYHCHILEHADAGMIGTLQLK